MYTSFMVENIVQCKQGAPKMILLDICETFIGTWILCLIQLPL